MNNRRRTAGASSCVFASKEVRWLSAQPRDSLHIHLLAMAGLALGWLGLVMAGFAQGGFIGGVLAIILATIVAVLYLLIIRISLELVVVVFRIGHNIDRLANGPGPTGGFPGSSVV